ncbi:hypothetical protein [Sulfurimonas sp.]|uniref:hypothetical protein n=1 Tax=Sulfurimonas sp. TaxID=2022749 RepID=UPI003566F8EB
MLNTEQTLIKVAQYFDLDLIRLGIKQSAEKSRLYKRQLTKETIEHIINSIDKEIESLDINSFIKETIKEFMGHYNYITKEIYSAYDEKREKEIDWFLLKHFIVPFFAIRLSHNTSLYDDRIDKGLPGGDFWYLPTFESSKSKILFPVNKAMKWLIDLHGGSNHKFYSMDKYPSSENTYLNISSSTLKKWHDELVLPDDKNIKELASFKFIYEGVFTKDKEDSLEKQFNSALEFIKSKSLSLDELKLEVPNLDNLLDRLYSESLSDEEKTRFILYIEQRWAKPTAKQIEYLLRISRVSQACYKDLCKYFNIDEKATTIDDNKAMQLVGLFSSIHNTEIALRVNGSSEISELFESYIYKINKIQEHEKEGLDQIIASIYDDMSLKTNSYNIEEILILFSPNKENRKQAIMNFEIKKAYESKKEKVNTQVYQAIKYIEDTADEENILNYIYSITDNEVLHNIGDYFEGNNYLTNEQVKPNLAVALTIHVRYSLVAKDLLHKQNAYSKVLNILTFSYYPRMLDKEDVDEWLLKLEKISNVNDFRSNLINLSYRGYHLINQKNEIEIIPLIEEYIKLVKEMKPQEYNPQFLFVAQDYMLKIKNKKTYNKLTKINEKHPLYRTHNSNKFHFYR